MNTDSLYIALLSKGLDEVVKLDMKEGNECKKHKFIVANEYYEGTADLFENHHGLVIKELYYWQLSTIIKNY